MRVWVNKKQKKTTIIFHLVTIIRIHLVNGLLSYQKHQNETKMLRFVGVGFCLQTTRNIVGYCPCGLAIPSTLMKEPRSWKEIWRMMRLRVLLPQVLKILCCRVIYRWNGCEVYTLRGLSPYAESAPDFTVDHCSTQNHSIPWPGEMGLRMTSISRH